MESAAGAEIGNENIDGEAGNENTHTCSSSGASYRPCQVKAGSCTPPANAEVGLDQYCLDLAHSALHAGGFSCSTC